MQTVLHISTSYHEAIEAGYEWCFHANVENFNVKKMEAYTEKGERHIFRCHHEISRRKLEGITIKQFIVDDDVRLNYKEYGYVLSKVKQE